MNTVADPKASAKLDAGTFANAIESFAVPLRDEGFVPLEVRELFAGLGATCAPTVAIRASVGAVSGRTVRDIRASAAQGQAPIALCRSADFAFATTRVFIARTSN